MKLITKFFNKTRTLRVNILTLFLTLTIVSFAVVITFTYSRNYKQILISAKDVAERVNKLIVEKFTRIALGSERMTEITSGIFFNLGPISLDNTQWKSFMLNVVKYDPNYTNFYIGLADGSFFGVFNLAFSSQSTFVLNPSKPLVPQTVFAIRNVNRSIDPPSDTWYYYNDQFDLLATETVASTAVYDSRQRPWFQGVMKEKGLYWTDFYSFHPIRERGITVANPVFNKQKEIIAVVAADLTFVQLSRFLSQQMIGKTGRAFMVDREGEIRIPHNNQIENASITESVVSDVMKWYSVNPNRPDFVFNNQGVDYLAYVSPVTVITGREWLIVIIAPLKDFFESLLKLQRDVILIIIGVLVISSLIIAYFAQKISAPIVTLANEVNKITQLELESETRVKSNIKEIFLIDHSIAALRRALRSFARYVPKAVVKELFQKGEEINLGGEKKQITIFFSDIAGFTTIAEALPIDVLTPLLAEYFDVMTKIIQESRGTIDKFMGDGIMAFWGAPLDLPDHASRACTAALQCNAVMSKFNQRRREKGKPEFLTRFGINTGTVIVGNIGTKDRMNYTVIGDAVNLTARLQEVGKLYHTPITISEDVYKNIKDEFLTRPLDVVYVKGKKEKVKIYELVAKLQGNEEIMPTQQQLELCRAFTEAFDTYMRQEYEKARGLFQALSVKFPDDFPTQIFLKLIQEKSKKDV
jgi:adenylate cyclase